MNKTLIEWIKNPDGTQGYTWNPITGCLNGCEYCYARKLANGRLKQRYLANENLAGGYRLARGVLKEGAIIPKFDPFYPRFWPERLNELGFANRGLSKPKGIFVCDMGELFGDWLPEEWTREILRIIKMNDNYRFYLLTKQPQNLIKFSPFPDHCYVGVTATNRQAYLDATSANGLDGIQAKVKYISFEPLLEQIMPSEYRLKGINWVIIGAQTKPYKPPKWEWVSEIISACVDSNIPYFLKNNLEPIVPKVFGGDGELRQEMPG